MALKNLPENVVVSTITVTFSLNNIINTFNFAKYAEITKFSFNKIVFGTVPENILEYDSNSTKYVVRSFYPILQKRKRNTTDHSKKTDQNSNINELNNQIEQEKMRCKVKRKSSENNQCRIKIWSSYTKECVSVSVFNNGSVHITGIKSHEMFEEIYFKIINQLLKQKCLYDSQTSTFIHVPFLENEFSSELLSRVQDFKICMINCTFDVYFNIKLDEMEKLMKSLDAPSKLDVAKHACVNTKFPITINNSENDYDNYHEVSIFIFESGKINITGSRNLNEITSAYEYIVKILYSNIKKVILINIERLDPQVIRQYID